MWVVVWWWIYSAVMLGSIFSMHSPQTSLESGFAQALAWHLGQVNLVLEFFLAGGSGCGGCGAVLPSAEVECESVGDESLRPALECAVWVDVVGDGLAGALAFLGILDLVGVQDGGEGGIVGVVDAFCGGHEADLLHFRRPFLVMVAAAGGVSGGVLPVVDHFVDEGGEDGDVVFAVEGVGVDEDLGEGGRGFVVFGVSPAVVDSGGVVTVKALGAREAGADDDALRELAGE